MVDLMSLLRDVLVCSLQVWMLNDFGKNMFPYRVERRCEFFSVNSDLL